MKKIRVLLARWVHRCLWFVSTCLPHQKDQRYSLVDPMLKPAQALPSLPFISGRFLEMINQAIDKRTRPVSVEQVDHHTLMGVVYPHEHIDTFMYLKIISSQRIFQERSPSVTVSSFVKKDLKYHSCRLKFDLVLSKHVPCVFLLIHLLWSNQESVIGLLNTSLRRFAKSYGYNLARNNLYGTRDRRLSCV